MYRTLRIATDHPDIHQRFLTRPVAFAIPFHGQESAPFNLTRQITNRIPPELITSGGDITVHPPPAPECIGGNPQDLSFAEGLQDYDRHHPTANRGIHQAHRTATALPYSIDRMEHRTSNTLQDRRRRA